jgi:outer membrane protein assembly factor BamA
MSTCRPTSGRGRLRAAALAALVLTLAAAAPAVAQDAPVDRTLRLETVSIVPDDPGTRALVQRYLSLAPGAPVDVATLNLARQTLEETGYFREVILYTARGSAPGQVILHVEVDLDRRLRFLTGYGYEPLDGWYLNLLGARLLNRPRPGGEVRLAWRDGFFVNGLYLEASSPTGERPGDAWRGELFVQTKAWFVYDGRETWRQNIDQTALRLGRTVPLGERGSVTAWGGISRIDPSEELTAFFDEDDQKRPASDLIGDSVDPEGYLDLLIEAEWQDRDAVRPWWQGSWLGARLRASHQGGGSSFFTAELDGRRYWPLGDHNALAGRARVAFASGGTPYHQRFQFGGVYSVRGYDFAYLSGPLGASELVQGNLELRIPLLDRDAALPRVTGLAFLDTGQSWSEGGKSYGWTVGAGYGVRVRLPWVQYLGVDVGFPLVELDDISPFVVNIALGWSY